MNAFRLHPLLDAQTGTTGCWRDLTAGLTFVVEAACAQGSASTDDVTLSERAAIRRRYAEADTPLKWAALEKLRNRIDPDTE